jgi:hypothetical protein
MFIKNKKGGRMTLKELIEDL